MGQTTKNLSLLWGCSLRLVIRVVERANNTKFGLASGVFTLDYHGDVDKVVDRATNSEFRLPFLDADTQL